jgi:hypothetical protein
MNPPPISSGWGDNLKSGPAQIWALWFQNVWNVLNPAIVGNDIYVTTTNITHGGALSKSMSVTKIGRQVALILTYSDTVSTSSTVGTTTFSLPYIPLSTSVVSAINSTTHASLGNGYVSTDGNLYPPTCTSGAGEVIVMTVNYFS